MIHKAVFHFIFLKLFFGFSNMDFLGTWVLDISPLGGLAAPPRKSRAVNTAPVGNDRGVSKGTPHGLVEPSPCSPQSIRIILHTIMYRLTGRVQLKNLGTLVITNCL